MNPDANSLIVIMVIFGGMSLGGDAATQAFLPRLIRTGLSTRAHSAMDQGSAVGQAAGPLAAGGLVRALGAPWTVLIDAASYLASGLTLMTIRTVEPRPAMPKSHPIGPDIVEDRIRP